MQLVAVVEAEQLGERDAAERDGHEGPQRQPVGRVAEQDDADREREAGGEDVRGQQRGAAQALAAPGGRRAAPVGVRAPRRPLRPRALATFGQARAGRAPDALATVCRRDGEPVALRGAGGRVTPVPRPTSGRKAVPSSASAARASDRPPTPSLANDAERCVLTVLREIMSRAGDLLVGGAVGGEREDLALAVAERRRLEALAGVARDDREADPGAADGERERDLGLVLPDHGVDALAERRADGPGAAAGGDGDDVALEARVARLVEDVDRLLDARDRDDQRAGARRDGGRHQARDVGALGRDRQAVVVEDGGDAPAQHRVGGEHGDRRL